MITISNEKKKYLEVALIFVVALVLVGLSRLETRLFELSDRLATDRSFIPTVIYFGSINFNVILVLVLSFLILRNVAKLLIERRRGVFGSQLRVKLFSVLFIFALAPSAVLYYVSTGFITRSLDSWLGDKIRTLTQDAQTASATIYRQDQRRLETIARVAAKKIHFERDPVFKSLIIDPTFLRGFDLEYGVSQVTVFDAHENKIFESGLNKSWNESDQELASSLIERFRTSPGLISLTTVESEDNRDIARGWYPIIYESTQTFAGLVIIKETFETRILKSVEVILTNFQSLRPSAQVVRISFIVLMTVMTLIIVFAAIWLGLYVTRGIIGPIQSLAEATREVALGNYDIALTAVSDDETGTLVRSFNRMTQDLKKQKEQVEESNVRLQISNQELEERRKYIEFILRNISAGVVAIDGDKQLTLLNQAAESLLRINGKDVIGKNIESALSPMLREKFWGTVKEKLGNKESATCEITLDFEQLSANIVAHITRVMDERSGDRGLVIVFDDATEQIKIQKIIAWREVARRIAHEIKNPITPIKLSAQRLSRRFSEQFTGEDKQVFETCVETILTQVDVVRDLVNEFSKFSRMPTMQLKKQQLNTLVLDVVDLYKLNYPDVEFDISGLQNVPEVSFDYDQLNRAVVNIVKNAIEAMSGQANEKKISFVTKVETKLNVLRLKIIDCGPGIPAKFRDRIMEPYFSTKEHGTGLGLSIVNQIVSDHGGYLRIADAEGRGVMVTIDLPLELRREDA